MNEPARRVSGPLSAKAAIWRLACAVVLAGAAFAVWQFFFAGSNEGSTTADQASPKVPVITGTASVRDVPVWLSGIGTVTPLNKVDVKVRVDGELQNVFFTEGQDVAAGQILAQIDPRPYRAALTQAQATQQRDMAQYASAQQEVVRAQKLSSAGAGTTQNLDMMKAQQAALKATLEADQAAIDSAQLNLGFASVLSPLAGRVGMRQIDPGSIVHASDAAGLVTVTQMAPIGVLFSVSQDELSEIVQGERKGSLPVAVATRDDSQHIADGKLVFIDSSINQNTGEVELKAEFANEDRVLWPGEFVSARVLVRTDRNATVVPDEAVQTGQNGFYVYIVKPGNVAAVQAVTTGSQVAGFTEIRSGLVPGQQVILNGQSRLAPGTPVTITPDEAAPAAGSGARAAP